jgi:hypothetical protein
MKASIRDIFPRLYDAAQTDASVRYIETVDRTLIEDDTLIFVFRCRQKARRQLRVQNGRVHARSDVAR